MSAAVTRQTYLPCHTADMSAGTLSRHVCFVTQQSCVLCDTGDMSTVSCSRYVSCVTQQTCVLCDTEDMSAVSHNRHACCTTQQTCGEQGRATLADCKLRKGKPSAQFAGQALFPRTPLPHPRKRQETVARRSASCSVMEKGGPLHIPPYTYA